MGRSLKDVYSSRTSSTKLIYFCGKYQERFKIAEYPVLIFDTSRASVLNVPSETESSLRIIFISSLVFPYCDYNIEQDTMY